MVSAGGNRIKVKLTINPNLNGSIKADNMITQNQT